MAMDLVIPKTAVLVDILQADRDCEEFYLFLNQVSPLRNGPQTLEEFLNSQQLFIPAKRALDGRFQIVNGRNIIYIREKEPVGEQPLMLIQVELRNQETLLVGPYEPMPAANARPIDFLNSPHVFLAFIQGQTRIYINKNHILRAGEQ